ncbi:MAG TPA: heavy metal-associated domain-containing protein [Galbitalea sp.]
MISEYTVTGMSCDHCVHSVSTELLSLRGVSDISVDLPTGLVRVTSEAPLPLDAVSAAVDEAGYELAGTTDN